MIPLATLPGWLATYAIHSTILLSLAYLGARRVPSDAWRDLLWKTALLGGLLTASLQIGIGYAPLAGRYFMEGAPVDRTEREVRSVHAPAPAALPRGERSEGAGVSDGAVASGSATTAPREGSPAATGNAGSEDPGDRGASWPELLMTGWAALAILLLARLALQHVWLFRGLRDRRRLDSGPVAGMLAELRRNTGVWMPVRLSTSSGCPTPIALGRSEICVPERFLTDLDADQQRSALAHELAHLRRGDPLWQLSAGILESVFFFQPLNGFARRRWREAAENLCDDWAVQSTGSALGLARCLADVASWSAPLRVPETTAAMAEGGSPLLRRVERLAEWRQPKVRAPWVRPLTAAALLTAVALVAPGVSQRALVSGAAPAVAALAPDTGARGPTPPRPPANAQSAVISLADPSVPLSERWSRALERDLPGGFWVAWGVDGRVRPERAIVITGGHPVVSGDAALSSNSPGPGAHTREAPSLRGILPAGADVPGVAFVFGFAEETDEAEGMSWIRLRSADAPLDLVGRPLVWLGRAGTAESLALLRLLYDRVEDPALRKEMAAAITLHDDERAVIRAATELVAREESAPVRAEAIQWLPRGQEGSPELVALLARTAEQDPSPLVRREAVDALGQIGSPAAREALLRLARTSPHPEVRREAVDALGSDASALLGLVRSDLPADARAEAVEALGRNHGDRSVAILLSTAFEDRSSRVRQEAVDQLAGIGSADARVALERILATHPDARVRAEAAEALARRVQ